VINPLEAVSIETASAVFETNWLCTIAMTQAVRARRAGVIVNVTSAVTLASLPLLSVYKGSKAAVNAFTESLAWELAPLGIRARPCCRAARRRRASARTPAPGGVTHADDVRRPCGAP